MISRNKNSNSVHVFEKLLDFQWLLLTSVYLPAIFSVPHLFQVFKRKETMENSGLYTVILALDQA